MFDMKMVSHFIKVLKIKMILMLDLNHYLIIIIELYKSIHMVVKMQLLILKDNYIFGEIILIIH